MHNNSWVHISFSSSLQWSKSFSWAPLAFLFSSRLAVESLVKPPESLNVKWTLPANSRLWALPSPSTPELYGATWCLKHQARYRQSPENSRSSSTSWSNSVILWWNNWDPERERERARERGIFCGSYLHLGLWRNCLHLCLPLGFQILFSSVLFVFHLWWLYIK